MNRELDLNAKSVHEAIDAQISIEGIKHKPVKPLIAPVLAQPHTAIYKMHRYYARRPHNVFARIIENYSNPGDLILDPFSGGGVTIVEGLKLKRRVIGVDLNPLATWITKVEVESTDLDEFSLIFDDWYKSIENIVKELFKAKCPECNKSGVAEWYEWSNVVICPNCKKDIILGKAQKLKPGIFQCTNPKCRSHIEPSKCQWIGDKLLNVLVRCEYCESTHLRPCMPTDEKRYKAISENERKIIKSEKLSIPSERFPDMDRARDDNVFGKGIRYFRDLMTSRQRIIHAHMLKQAKSLNLKPNELAALLTVISSVLRFTNKMVMRSEAWRGEKPLEWPGHNYWLPFTYLEASPLGPLVNRFKAVKAGKNEQDKYISNFSIFPKTQKPWDEFQNGATCWILTQSSENIKLPDASIDAIITDPPFGGNVQYGELSDFYLSWLKDFLNLSGLTDKSNEAIETRHQGFDGAKDREFYENMLFKIFKESRRVLKPDGWMVLTFHNRDIGVWMSLHRAALRAGFRLPSEAECANRGMVYQPPVQNYTQTIHQRAAGSMLGDFILSFRPTEIPTQLESIKSQLNSEEEKELTAKAEEIIRYHGGADETTLMTGLVPYLSQNGLLARLARFDLRLLLANGPFVFQKAEKKWLMSDMVQGFEAMSALNVIPAEAATQQLIYSYLTEHKRATLDELLVVIYSQLVNSYRPQMSTIDKVLLKYCKKIKGKNQRRESFIWDPQKLTPEQTKAILAAQLPLTLESGLPAEHNAIIATICHMALKRSFRVHVGQTEQKKSPMLGAMSTALMGLELGLSPEAFKLIREIDLIILRGSTMLAAVEVATSISTFNKAINDRFRNLITIAPNLSITLSVLVKPEDFAQAHAELYTPANIEANLSSRVKLYKIGEIDEQGFIEKIIGHDL